VARFRNNFGDVLRDQGDLEGARVQLERALAVSEAALGPDHPDVAIRRNNLGGLLHALGDLEGAKAELERALVIGEAALGSEHPDVANWRHNLGSVLADLGDLAGAKAQYERALAVAEQRLALTTRPWPSIAATSAACCTPSRSRLKRDDRSLSRVIREHWRI
jgi:tetratricopeptide (TPR) repeat protein